MLVLSREVGERIDVAGGAANGGVTFTIVEIRPGKVRVGIEAPREIPVHRREVQELIDSRTVGG